MNTDTVDTEKTLTTADFAAAGARPAERTARTAREAADADGDGRVERREGEGEELAALFPPEMAGDFRSRWDAVQIGFVDDPRQAVQRADELVAQVMKNLAESFADERQRFEEQMSAPEGGASTENMRVALRRYRSFFQRLLSL
ncbi:MAG: hypothetical protein Q8R01_13130 [Ramlibacter sp.]|nr:hypothetical protein [Ramlibacter sp.]